MSSVMNPNTKKESKIIIDYNVLLENFKRQASVISSKKRSSNEKWADNIDKMSDCQENGNRGEFADNLFFSEDWRESSTDEVTKKI